MTLDTLKTSGIILSISKDYANRKRLMEVGVLPGRKIQYITTLIFGSPIVFKINDMLIALSSTDAKQISIR
jgi:Fe2+ transport system protein FeoA